MFFSCEKIKSVSIAKRDRLGLAVSRILDAWRADKKLAANYLPLLGWTGYAGSVALYQALKNPDPVIHTPALANERKRRAAAACCHQRCFKQDSFGFLQEFDE